MEARDLIPREVWLGLQERAQHVLRKVGLDLVPYRPFELPDEATPEDVARIERVRPYTMTSARRIYSLMQAVRYIEAHRIEGDIVECGVWRGGSMMAAALELQELGRTGRDLWLFDTFTGLPEPGEQDVDFRGVDARDTYQGYAPVGEDGSQWCYAPREEVSHAMTSTGYPMNRVHLVEGKVEDTLPEQAPDQIALLRLDTDWYESTRHELEHLYPRLQPGGVLIIDDYGHWKGARQAVDEYFEAHGRPLIHPIDYTGRIAIKPPNHGEGASPR